MSTKKKKARFALVGVLLLILIAAGFWLNAKAEAAKETQKREEIASAFAVYQQFGLFYDMEADRLYYHNELVRYFEDVVSENRYKKWPNRDGTVDVHAVRGSSGELVGMEPFGEQAFLDRTAYLQTAVCELQITESIDGYTSGIEEQVKDSIQDAYAIYLQYGLTYGREQDRLYYEGELVGYFEDKSMGYSFGPYDDSAITIYAVRDDKGNLTGLDVKLAEK